MDQRILIFGCRDIGLAQVKRYTDMGDIVCPADEDADAEMQAAEIGGWLTDWSCHEKEGRSAEWIWCCHEREPFAGAIICPPYTERVDIRWACIEAGIPHVAVQRDSHIEITYSRETGHMGAATWFDLGDLETLRFIVGAEKGKRRCGATAKDHTEWCAKLDALVGRVERLVPRGTVVRRAQQLLKQVLTRS